MAQVPATEIEDTNTIKPLTLDAPQTPTGMDSLMLPEEPKDELRQPATQFDSDLDARSALTPDQQIPAPDAVIQQENEKKAKEEIKDGFFDSIPGEMLIGAAAIVPTMAEDIYNTGVDFTNYISTQFGGPEVLENSDIISRQFPESTPAAITREMGQFLIAFSKIGKLSKVKDFAKINRSAKIASKVGAGMLTDLFFTEPEQETLVFHLMRKTGIGSDVADYLNSPETPNAVKRLQNSLFGVVDGVIAAGVFKGISMLKKIRIARKVVETAGKAKAKVGEVVKDASRKSGDAADTVAKSTRETPPPVAQVEDIPEIFKTRNEMPDLPPEVTSEFVDKNLKALPDNVVDKVLSGNRKASPNSVEMVNKAGDRVFRNVTTLNTTDDVRQVITTLIETQPEKFGKKVFTEAQMLKEAEKFSGMSAEEIAKQVEKEGLKRGQVLAAKQVEAEIAESTVNILERFHKGEVPRDTAAHALAIADSATQAAKQVTSEPGVLLREGAVVVEKGAKSGRDKARYLKDLTDMFGGNLDLIAKEVHKGGDDVASALLTAIKDNAIMPIANRLTQIRYAGMLFNPATHMRNLYGGIQTTLLRPAETLLAATLNAIQKNPIGVQFAEAHHEALGLAEGFFDALRITGKKLTGDKTAKFIGVDPANAKLPQFVSQVGSEPTSTMGKALRFLDEQIIQGKFVGDALQAEDNFVKHINARMTLSREAYRTGYIASLVEGSTAESVQKIIAKELADPSKGTLSMMYREAEVATFTNNLSPQDFSGVLKSLSDHPLGRLVAPFAKVNINAMKYTFERIPGFNMIFESSKAQWNSKIPAVAQRARAKMALSSSVLTALGLYLHGKDVITGSGPLDPSLRNMRDQMGIIDGSIKVGDSWVEFRKETPLGKILSSVVTMAELADAVDGDNQQYMNDVGLGMTAITASLFNPEYLTDTVGKLFEAMAKGDVNAAQKLLHVGGSIASTFAPYAGGARQFTRQMTEAGSIKRETFDPGSALDTFMNQVTSVYAPDMLIPKRNILGHTMPHKTGFGPDLISPFGVSKETENPVIQEIARLSGANHILLQKPDIEGSESTLDADFIKVSKIPKVISMTLGGRQVTKKLGIADREKLTLFSAGIHPKLSEDQKLESVLSKLFKSKSYKERGFREQGLSVDKVLSRYRSIGKKLFFGQDSAIQELELVKEEILRDAERRRTIKAINK